MRRRLFRIQLDDKMLFDFLFNIASFGQLYNFTGKGCVVELEPLGEADRISRFDLFENLLVLFVLLFFDTVPFLAKL